MFLLLPLPGVPEMILGVLARAQAISRVQIHGFVILSNHLHMLVTPRDAGSLSAFMRYFKSNVTKELKRLVGFKGSPWDGRYDAAIVQDDIEDQVARFLYILRNGTKEGLVASPLDWLGPSSVHAIVGGTWRIRGEWYDRTKEYRARLAGRSETVKSVEYVTITPLPCWAGETLETIQRRVRDFVRLIEERTHRMHQRNGTRPVGMAKILERSRFDAPDSFRPTPAPWFHASRKEDILALGEEIRGFRARHREASKRYMSGDLGVTFPAGSFPPPRPLVQV